MNEEGGGQVDIDQFDFKVLGKEFVCQIECTPYFAEKVIKDKIVMAGCQNHRVEQIRHGYEVSHSQYKPNGNHPKKYPAQFVQVVPKSQLFVFCHYAKIKMERAKELFIFLLRI